MASDYMIIDDFLSDWALLRQYLTKWATFSDEEGRDGVVYPGICKDIDQPFVDHIWGSLKNMGGKTLNYSFARLSLGSTAAPHQAHSDAEWGEWSMMLYMNLLEDCEGGTAFLRHSSGFSTHPINQKQIDHWVKDHNDPSAWTVTDMVEMYPNRAVIFPSKRMHRAEPIGGFGDNVENGRLVVTAFFS